MTERSLGRLVPRAGGRGIQRLRHEWAMARPDRDPVEDGLLEEEATRVAGGQYDAGAISLRINIPLALIQSKPATVTKTM